MYWLMNMLVIYITLGLFQVKSAQIHKYMYTYTHTHTHTCVRTHILTCVCCVVQDSKSEGTMLKETTNINKSLFVLGKVRVY